MAVGLPLKTTYADGDVYAASDVNDTNGTINITAAPYAAGKNKIINGDFTINQRNFTSTTTNGAFGYDRWNIAAVDGTTTFSSQQFTPGTAPVAGYEGTNYAQITTTGQTATNAQSTLRQRIEDVRTYAGQTVTLSFWAKSSSGTPSIAVELVQGFGTGGSPSAAVNSIGVTKQAITTSWTRYSFTISVPSISGKTIGTDANSSLLLVNTWISAGTDFNSRTGSLGIQTTTIDIWGVQLEAGSTATAFQTATGTIQGELALCQRYYYQVPDGLNESIGMAFYLSATELDLILQLPVQMRTTPTLTQTSGTDYFKFTRNGGTDNFDGFTLAGESTTATVWAYNNSGASGTAGQAGLIQFNNALAKLAFSSEF